MSTMNKKKRKQALKSLKRDYRDWHNSNPAQTYRNTQVYYALQDFVMLSDDADQVWTMLRHYRNEGEVAVP